MVKKSNNQTPGTSVNETDEITRKENDVSENCMISEAFGEMMMFIGDFESMINSIVSASVNQKMSDAAKELRRHITSEECTKKIDEYVKTFDETALKSLSYAYSMYEEMLDKTNLTERQAMRFEGYIDIVGHVCADVIRKCCSRKINQLLIDAADSDIMYYIVEGIMSPYDVTDD